MARKILTDEMVIDAINELVSLGEVPSTKGIYDHLGQRGSYSTINKILQNWREKNESHDQVHQKIDVLLPGEIQDSFLNLGKKLWTQATNIASKELDKQRDLLVETEQEIKQQLADATYIAETAESKVNELEEKLESESKLKVDIERQVILKDGEIERLKKELDKLKTLVSDKDNLVEDLSNTVNELKQSLALSEQSLNTAKKDNERILIEFDKRVEQLVDTHTNSINVIKEQYDLLVSKIDLGSKEKLIIFEDNHQEDSNNDKQSVDDLINQELEKGLKRADIVNILNDGGYLTSTGKKWTVSTLNKYIQKYLK